MDENTVAVGKDIDLETVILQNVDLVENIGAFKEVAEQFQQLMMMYSCAIREVKTKLEVLNDELSVRNQRNPIDRHLCCCGDNVRLIFSIYNLS